VCDKGAEIGLRFDRAAGRSFEGGCSLSQIVSRLAIKALSDARGLIDCALSLRSGIAGSTANASCGLPPRLRAVPSKRFSSTTVTPSSEIKELRFLCSAKPNTGITRSAIRLPFSSLIANRSVMHKDCEQDDNR
jgi:hypothetical protein